MNKQLVRKDSVFASHIMSNLEYFHLTATYDRVLHHCHRKMQYCLNNTKIVDLDTFGYFFQMNSIMIIYLIATHRFYQCKHVTVDCDWSILLRKNNVFS